MAAGLATLCDDDVSADSDRVTCLLDIMHLAHERNARGKDCRGVRRGVAEREEDCRGLLLYRELQ